MGVAGGGTVSTFRLMWWEHAELLDHLNDRPDIWMQSPDVSSMWIRMEKSDLGAETPPAAATVVHFTPPSDETSPYRQYGVVFYPLAWTSEEIDTYFTRLLTKWTSYGRRLEYAQTLEQCGVENAQLVAVALLSTDHVDSSDGLPPDWDEGIADGMRPLMAAPTDPLHVGTFLLSNGGYCRLDLRGGMLAVALSIPHPGAGYGPVMKGFVRPIDGRIRDAAVFLTGRGTPMASVAEDNRNQGELF